MNKIKKNHCVNCNQKFAETFMCTHYNRELKKLDIYCWHCKPLGEDLNHVQ